MKQITITIREDQVKWIRKTRWFNFSGFVQEKLDEVIEKGV